MEGLKDSLLPGGFNDLVEVSGFDWSAGLNGREEFVAELVEFGAVVWLDDERAAAAAVPVGVLGGTKLAGGGAGSGGAGCVGSGTDESAKRGHFTSPDSRLICGLWVAGWGY